MPTTHELSTLLNEHVPAFRAQFPDSVGFVIVAIERLPANTPAERAAADEHPGLSPVVWSNMEPEQAIELIALLADATPDVRKLS